jgi:hypothetical protein
MGGRRRWACQLASLAGALAVALAVMVWGASSASAGGPTSVLVASPESGESAALYYSDKEYGELQQLLGPSGTGTKDAPPQRELGGDRMINVTWLAHDIWPWRMDRVFPGASGSGSGSVWIHTAADVPNSMNGYWHRAAHPGQLRALLKKLGVMGKGRNDGYTGIFPAPWEQATPSATAEPNAGTTPERAAGTTAVRVGSAGSQDGTDWWSNWWWTLPGAAAGAALALVLRPFVGRGRPDRRRPAHEPGPRRELRDV